MTRFLASALLTVWTSLSVAGENEFLAWVGLRNGTLAAFDHDTLTEGYTLGWRNDLAVRPWLRLRIGNDRSETVADQIEIKAPGVQRRADYELEQSLWRIGLVPRVQAGPATLMLGAEWLSLTTEEAGDSGGLFGAGRRHREGLGIGGTSVIALAPTLDLIGEASGYRVNELEGVDAGMRLLWSPRTPNWRGTQFYVEGIERRVVGRDQELRERDFRLGLSRRF